MNVNTSAFTILLFNKHAKVCCPAYMKGCHQLVAVHWTLPQINPAANTQKDRDPWQIPLCNSPTQKTPTIAFSLSVSKKWLDISSVRLSPYSLNLAKLSIWQILSQSRGWMRYLCGKVWHSSDGKSKPTPVKEAISCTSVNPRVRQTWRKAQSAVHPNTERHSAGMGFARQSLETVKETI